MKSRIMGTALTLMILCIHYFGTPFSQASTSNTQANISMQPENQELTGFKKVKGEKMQESDYLKDMYQDDYYPDFLVDKIKVLLKEVVVLLESGETDLVVIQAAFDKATIGINVIADEFYENDSDIETVARDSIGTTVDLILTRYNIAIDGEEAIRERDW